jgi:DNA polymerase III sliding clamp (beta) subunit (PCNA family)
MIREIRVGLPASVETPGSRTVHAELLTNFVSQAYGEIVQIKFQEGRLLIKSGRTWAAIPSLEAEAYYSPLAAQVDGVSFTLSNNEFQKTIGDISVIADEDQDRPIVSGVWVYPADSKWVCVATTGVKVIETKVSAPENGASLRPIVIPKRSAQLASALFPGPAEMLLSKTMASFFDDSTSFTTLLLDVVFNQDYVKKIEPGPLTVTMSRKGLAKGIARIKDISDYLGMSCRNNQMRLFTARADGARAEDIVDCVGDLPFDLTMRIEYFEPILHALSGDNLTLRFFGNADPVLMYGERDGERGAVWPKRPENKEDEYRA